VRNGSILSRGSAANGRAGVNARKAVYIPRTSSHSALGTIDIP
jgi:hypothetical protein